MRKNFIISFGLLFFLALIFFVFSNCPNLTESIYSTGIYPYIGITLRFLFGKIPFSVGDIFYTCIGLFPIYFLVKIEFKMQNYKK